MALAQVLESKPLIAAHQALPVAVDDTPKIADFHAPRSDSFWAPFKMVPGDFKRFMSSLDSGIVLGAGAASALVASRWDGQSLNQLQDLGSTSSYKAGNFAGQFLVQMGAGFGVYSLARATGNEKLSAVGGDLLRAQMLSQGIVQIGKLTTQRQRPDGSNSHSMPSGHTASAFASASVLQRHYGWKVGVPAYGFGAYVAAARMSANKHNLSDVLMGAAVGIAAGRSVTVGIGGSKFAMGVAPTIGGAAITFTKKQ